MRPGQAVDVSSETVGFRNGKSGAVFQSEGERRDLLASCASGRSRNGTSGAVFESEGERRALLLRMGTDPAAWVYLDTLARAARMPRNGLRLKLETLEQEGLLASKRAPAGRRYRLTDDGRRVRGWLARPLDEVATRPVLRAVASGLSGRIAFGVHSYGRRHCRVRTSRHGARQYLPAARAGTFPFRQRPRASTRRLLESRGPFSPGNGGLSPWPKEGAAPIILDRHIF
jgi:DNA-binding IscR family transcriptional regulator